MFDFANLFMPKAQLDTAAKLLNWWALLLGHYTMRSINNRIVEMNEKHFNYVFSQ